MRFVARTGWFAHFTLSCIALLTAPLCSACFIFSADDVPPPVVTEDTEVVDLDLAEGDPPDDNSDGAEDTAADTTDTVADESTPDQDIDVSDTDLEEVDIATDETEADTDSTDVADTDSTDVADSDATDVTETDSVDTAETDLVDLAETDTGPEEPQSWAVYSPAIWENLTPGGNRVENPGFENVLDGTTFPQRESLDDGRTPDEDNPHTGERSAYVWSDNPDGDYGGSQLVHLGQDRPRAFWVEGWSRNEAAVGSAGDDYSLFLHIEDRIETTFATIPFPPSAESWEHVHRLFIPTEPVNDVTVFAIFKDFTGEAWFDDIALHELEDILVNFDGEQLVVEDPELDPDQPSVTVASANSRVSIELSEAGGWIKAIEVDELDMTSDAQQRSGLFVRDQAVQSQHVHFGGSLEAIEGGFQQVGDAGVLDLAIDAEWISQPRHIEVSGTVRSTSDRDRAITLYLALPAAADELRRYDRIRVNELIEPGETVSHYWEYEAEEPVGGTGQYSINTFGGVGADSGIAVGYPMDHPQYARIFYSDSAQQLVIAVDFGLSTLTDPASEAKFSFVVYPFDTEWGFRSMLHEYSRMFPEFFARGTATEGIWVHDPDLTGIADLAEFGIGFRGIDEWNLDDVLLGENLELGILSMRRLYPPSLEDLTVGDVDRDDTRAVSDRLGIAAPSAVTNSLIQDRDGLYRFEINNSYGSCEDVCVQVALNADPDVDVGEGEFNWTTRNWGSGQILDYLDHSLGGEFLYNVPGFGDLLNYRQDHFPAAQIPLVYARGVWEPAVLTLHSTYEGMRSIRDDLPEGIGSDPTRSAILSGVVNFNSNSFYAHLLDMAGDEVALVDDTGAIDFSWIDGVEGDEYMMAMRTAMLSKQVHLVLQGEEDDLTADNVSQFMHFCLFYGVFPSFEDHYFENDVLRERDRQLFIDTIPIVNALSTAGWEPITAARTNDGNVWIERFGTGSSGVYLTLRNRSGGPTTVTVTTGLSEIGMSSAVSVHQPNVKTADSVTHLEVRRDIVGRAVTHLPADSALVEAIVVAHRFIGRLRVGEAAQEVPSEGPVIPIDHKTGRVVAEHTLASVHSGVRLARVVAVVADIRGARVDIGGLTQNVINSVVATLDCFRSTVRNG